eukprot:gene10516-21930_t
MNLSPKSLKRKPLDDIESCSLSDQIKRFRITVTPGELRMQKDLKSIQDVNGISFDYFDHGSCVVIRFKETCRFCPQTFQITIPRFYPHDKPIVRSLDKGFFNEYIDMEGKINHVNFGANWTAICSISDIIATLQHVRISFLSSPA